MKQIDSNNIIRLSTIALTGLGACILSSASVAATPDPWQFSIMPYFNAANIDVTTTVGDIKTEVDLDSGDVLEKFENGFMAMMSARKGKWVFGLDASYFKLADGQSKSVSGPFGRETAHGAIDVTSRQWIYQPMAGYRVLDDQLQLDLYGGARYTRLRLNLEIDITTSIPAFPGGSPVFSSEMDWTDVVLGGHIALPINDQWSVVGLTDIGFGEQSDHSYQVLSAVRWQFHEGIATSMGYRLLDQKHEEGNVTYEATFDGIILGLAFDF